MKAYLLAGLAAVAMASTANAQSDASPFTGPYVGAQVGYANLQDVHDDLDGWYDDFQNYRQTDGNIIAGVRGGYDYAVGSGVLIGALAEFNLTNLNTVGATDPDDDTYKIGAKIKRMGSVRAKLGYTSGNLAVYGTAGLGFANVKHRMRDIDGSDEGYNRKGDRTGFVFGAGAAMALNGRSNIGFEVSQYDFGSKKHEVIDDGDGTDYFFKQDDRVRTATINYSFGF